MATVEVEVEIDLGDIDVSEFVEYHGEEYVIDYLNESLVASKAIDIAANDPEEFMQACANGMGELAGQWLANHDTDDGASFAESICIAGYTGSTQPSTAELASFVAALTEGMAERWGFDPDGWSWNVEVPKAPKAPKVPRVRRWAGTFAA